MNKTNIKEEQTGNQQKRTKKPASKVVRTAVLGTVLGLMASAIVGLSVSLYFSDRTVKTHESYQKQMDAVYFRAYYDLIDGANDMGISLKKLGASSSATMQQSLLYEVWTAASLAESNLGMFESKDDGLMKAQKFVNQLGDYAHALALRVASGEPLTAEERATLVKLGEVAQTFERALRKIGDDIDGGKMFVGDESDTVAIAGAFSEFAEPSFEYPEMIYDGPFSDALENRSPRFLTGEDISAQQGTELIKSYFSDYDPQDIRVMDEGRGDVFTLNYSARLDGSPAFIQLTKRSGKLLAFNMAPTEADAERTAKQDASASCLEAALAFAKKVGYDGLEVVWSSSADGECVVNLAPVQDGALLYPDLIKVKLRERDSRPIGFDATHYIFNHHVRRLPKPRIDRDSAKSALAFPTEGEGRIALIPLRGEREVLTYEFECQSDGTYFVYIDALTGDEANILYVIDDEENGMKTV